MLTKSTSEATCGDSDTAQIIGIATNEGFDYSVVNPSVATNLRRGAE